MTVEAIMAYMIAGSKLTLKATSFLEITEGCGHQPTIASRIT